MRVTTIRWRRATLVLAALLAPVAALSPATFASAGPVNPRLYIWGNNTFGQLGNGRMALTPESEPTRHDAELTTPTRVPGSQAWSDISSGTAHSIAIRKGGTMWAWGVNPYGLGALDASGNPVTVAPNPVKLPGGRGWVDVETSDSYSLAIQNDGSLWAWGNNSSGQLGVGDTEPRFTPTPVGSDRDWVSIVATPSGTSFALKADGSLWAWGNNSSGALGTGTIDDDPHPTPNRIPGTWRSVSAGGRLTTHVLAVADDGRLYAWGQNCRGQLGLGAAPVDASQWQCVNDFHPQPTQVGTKADWVRAVAGSTPIDGGFSMAIDSAGSLFAWGDNIAGGLGLGTSSTTGDALRASPTLVGEPGGWSKVALGYGFAVAIRVDGTLWSWGWNPAGQLGNGDPGPGLTSIETWLTDDSARQPTPARVGSLTGWLDVSAGGLHAMATR